MSKFTMSARILVNALGTGAVLVGTTVEAFAASKLPPTNSQRPEASQRQAGTDNNEATSAIAQVRVRTDRPSVPSRVNVGPVEITGPDGESSTAETPGVPSQQPNLNQNPNQNPALVPGAAPNRGINPGFTPGLVPNTPGFAPGFVNAPGIGVPPFNAGAQVVTPYPTILNLQPQSAVPGTGSNRAINSPNSPAPVQLVCNPGPYVAYAQAQSAVLATQLVAARQQVQAAEAEQERGGRGGSSVGNILLGALTPTIDVDLGGTELGIPLPIPALVSSLISGGGSNQDEDEAALAAQQQAAVQQQQIGQQILGGPAAVPGGGAVVPGIPGGAPTVASTQVFTSYPAVINVAVPDELLEQAQERAASPSSTPSESGAPASGSSPDLGGIQLVCGGAAPLIPQSALVPQPVTQPGLFPNAPVVPGTVPGTALPGNPSLFPQQGLPQQGPGTTSPVAPGTTLPQQGPGTTGPVAPGTTPPAGSNNPASTPSNSVEAEVGPIKLTVPRDDREE